MINVICALPSCTSIIAAGSADHHVLHIAVRRPNFTEATLDYCSAGHLQQGAHQVINALTTPAAPTATPAAP